MNSKHHHTGDLLASWVFPWAFGPSWHISGVIAAAFWAFFGHYLISAEMDRLALPHTNIRWCAEEN
jgi:hypothetical protein